MNSTSVRQKVPGRTIVSVAALLVALTLLYGFLVEPYWVETTWHEVHASISTPLKIAHLSDLHLARIGRLEQDILSRLRAEKPDLVVITGDLVANGSLVPESFAVTTNETYEAVGAFLERVRAPLGVYVVRGNWELTRRTAHERDFYDRTGATLLVNENREVRPGIFVAGFDDAVRGKPDIDSALRGIPAGSFVVGVFHSPDYFEVVSGRCNLAFAGHTHGGQVFVPFVTRLWLPRGAGRFVAGWYAARGSRLYVSRGIGTSTLPIRLLSRPELAIVTVL